MFYVVGTCASLSNISLIFQADKSKHIYMSTKIRRINLLLDVHRHKDSCYQYITFHLNKVNMSKNTGEYWLLVVGLKCKFYAKLFLSGNHNT